MKFIILSTVISVKQFATVITTTDSHALDNIASMTLYHKVNNIAVAMEMTIYNLNGAGCVGRLLKLQVMSASNGVNRVRARRY